MGRIVGRWGWWFLAGLPLLSFLAIPVASIAVRALGVRGAATPEFVQAVRLSFETSLISLVLIVALGTPLAFVTARFKFPFRWLANTLMDLPVVLPPAAAGIGLLLAFGRQGYLPTSFGFTTAAVVIAQCFVASPFYLRAATSAFSKFDQEVEESAALAGAGPLFLFFKISLPLSSSALTSGAITSWARALGEFGATILFAGNLVGKTQTMPLAIYLGFESDLDQSIGLSGILLGTAFLAIVFLRILAERDAKRT